MTNDDEYCPVREDQQHCNCWYDSAACCACGAPAELEHDWDSDKNCVFRVLARIGED